MVKIAFTFDLCREKIQEQNNEEQEQQGLCADEKSAVGRHRIEVAIANRGRGDDTKINRIKPMNKRFVQVISVGVQYGVCQNNFQIIKEQ